MGEPVIGRRDKGAAMAASLRRSSASSSGAVGVSAARSAKPRGSVASEFEMPEASDVKRCRTDPYGGTMEGELGVKQEEADSDEWQPVKSEGP